MAGNSFYQPPSNADWRAIKTSSGVQNATRNSAEIGKAYAQSISPVESGEYRDAFRVTSGVERGRAVAHLINDAPHAAEVEWGQRRHVLGRTADLIERSGGKHKTAYVTKAGKTIMATAAQIANWTRGRG